MKAINTLSAATAPSTATPNNANQAAPIAATNFNHYYVLGDGDCLFRAMLMGLFNQPGIEPSDEQIMGLRQCLANYVDQHQNTLACNPAFEGRQGVLNLYDLLLTPGQWNDNAGDLVPPLLAQLSGRPVVVLQSAGAGAYLVRQVFPAQNHMLPPGAPPGEEPAIWLAHINGNHYSYLEARYPNLLSNTLHPPQRSHPPSQPVSRENEPGQDFENRPNENNLSFKKGTSKGLSDAQEKEIIQLWQANPGWGMRRLASEYMQGNPGIKMTKALVQSLKKRHPALVEAGLGSTMRSKKNKHAQENDLINFWRERPRCGYRAVVREFNKHNSTATLSSSDARKLQKISQADPQKLTLGNSLHAKSLSDSQIADLVRLWRSHPQWGERKVALEFMQLTPGVTLTRSVVHRLKLQHPDLQGLAIGSTAKKKSLSNAQERDLVQLWRQHPYWGEAKVTQEYMARNPGTLLTRAVVNKLKYRMPGLQGVKLGANISDKLLSAEQEKAAVQLWRENPDWSEEKLAQEHLARNPGQVITKRMAVRLKNRHSELQELNVGTSPTNKKLTNSQTKALIELYLSKPLSGIHKIACEFNQRNLGVTISPSFVHRLKERYPEFKGQLMIQAIKNAPPAQRHLVMEKQLDQLAQKIQHINLLAPLDPQTQLRYKNLNKQLNMLQDYFAQTLGAITDRAQSEHVIAEQDTQSQGTFANLSNIFDIDALDDEQGVVDYIPDNDTQSQGTFASLSDIFDIDDLDDEQGSVDYIPEDDTQSQGTFAALSDIADVNGLSDEYGLSDASDNNSSQGTFSGLDDFEDISRLRDH